MKARGTRLTSILLILLIATPISALHAQASVADGPIQAAVERVDEKELPKSIDIDALDLKIDLSEDPLSDREKQAVEQLTHSISSTEWLGTLAPVALSPFFGLTCLSGLAIVGEDHLPEDHFLRSASTPLRNPLVFFTFLALTILTSLPKFSKVSKPFAQAVDSLEAYSAIIILLVIRYLGSVEVGGTEQVAVVYQAGIFEFSAETLLWLATAINIVVINTVKFFFEILTWITPVPFLDAIFELCNKALCAGLMAIYTYSPTLATVINLVLLALCLLAFRWIKRREVYYRTILFDFLRDFLKRDSTVLPDGAITVFPTNEYQDIPKLSRCELTKTADGWRIESKRLFRPAIVHHFDQPKPEIKMGLLTNEISAGENHFKFGKQFNSKMNELCEKLGVSHPATATAAPGALAGELA